MTLYKRISLYCFRRVRQLRYGRGRGIHSPKAYDMVQMLLQPRASYYDFEQYGSLFNSPLCQLIYRAIARLQPEKVILIQQDSCLEKIVRLASSSTIISHEVSSELHNTVVISSSIVDLTLTNSTYLIFTGIRRTKRVERVFKEWVDTIPSGMVLDLYDSALVTGIDEVKYIYRTTL